MGIDPKLIDQLLADHKRPEDIVGENGLLKQLTKAVLERAVVALPVVPGKTPPTGNPSARKTQTL